MQARVAAQGDPAGVPMSNCSKERIVACTQMFFKLSKRMATHSVCRHKYNVYIFIIFTKRFINKRLIIKSGEKYKLINMFIQCDKIHSCKHLQKVRFHKHKSV